MPTLTHLMCLLSGGCLVALAGCAADQGDDVTGDEADLTSTITLAAYGKRTYTLEATEDKDVTVTVDCAPPASPDDRGPVVSVSAPSLDADDEGPAPAGYWSRTGSVPAGTHQITLTNQGPAATCRITTRDVPAASTCRAWNEWRSANTDHTHFRVGDRDAEIGRDPFPASGNHWGSWAAWGAIYDEPVLTGFVLHNLEHGGLVLSYKCRSATESRACTDARDQLVALANQWGAPRIIVTPDPSQPAMFAIRAWRYAHTSDCLDPQAASDFARAHYRRGREDSDASPPIPFDPTTTNVPCQDLMAAPDSCAY